MALDIIYLLLFVPFFAGCLLAFGGPRHESKVALITTISARCHGFLTLALLSFWFYGGQKHLDLRGFEIYKTGDYALSMAFYVDSMSALFIFLVAFLSNMVITYSRYYLHREPGYQKFFACLMFLIFGLTLLTLAGTLDVLMAGWEFVGICSFLLIGFYQTRIQAIKNAFKVLTVYKFCDVGLLLGAWLSHLLWHDAQFFAVLTSPEARAHLADVGSMPLFLLSFMVLLAAAGKSAQWPFSFWISRAMEGPTPSSAIFYGALSVHAGVLLLHRMHPVWSATDYGPWLVGGLGLLTAIVCSGISRVQSNIKGQIAYSSAANVGLIFVEMALNLKVIAMVHLTANACLRCYQLLISPSVLAYLVRLQGSIEKPVTLVDKSIEGFLPDRLRKSLYVFCINDGYLERTVEWLLWQPAKKIGRLLQRFDSFLYWIVLPLLVIAIVLIRQNVHGDIRGLLSILSSLLTVGLAFAAFAEEKSAIRAWNTASLSALFSGLTILVLDPHTSSDVLVYGSGVLFFWVVGLQSLFFLGGNGGVIPMTRYNGMGLVAPGGSIMLFIAVLGVSGFPISPTYIGQDLILHHASSEFIWLVLVLALSIVINGISLARIYTRVCFGPRPSFSQEEVPSPGR
ncbi:MAG: proton-conducting transporter membrane subunit [bacterium]